MLIKILNEFRKSADPVSLSGLSQRLGIERNALEGMLKTLARQGKIREVRATAKSYFCGGCNTCTRCNQIRDLSWISDNPEHHDSTG